MKAKDIEEIAKKYKMVKGYDTWKYGGGTEYRLAFSNKFVYKKIELVLNFNAQLDTLDLILWSEYHIDDCFKFIIKELSKVKKTELEDCIKRAIALMKGAKHLRYREEKEENSLADGWVPWRQS